jgi:hypothetical protein
MVFLTLPMGLSAINSRAKQDCWEQQLQLIQLMVFLLHNVGTIKDIVLLQRM